MEVVFGTHPIPEKYFKTHLKLQTWSSESMQKMIEPALTDEITRLNYD